MHSRTMDKRVKKDKCILVAGMPWAGKTTFVSELKKKIQRFCNYHNRWNSRVLLWYYMILKFGRKKRIT